MGRGILLQHRREFTTLRFAAGPYALGMHAWGARCGDIASVHFGIGLIEHFGYDDGVAGTTGLLSEACSGCARGRRERWA